MFLVIYSKCMTRKIKTVDNNLDGLLSKVNFARNDILIRNLILNLNKCLLRCGYGNQGVSQYHFRVIEVRYLSLYCELRDQGQGILMSA
jgi:hypothetical protein